MILIGRHCAIPEEELTFDASRSSGPGGQNVNKVSSRITLRFNVRSSPSLRPDQKARLEQKLASRLGDAGVLRISSQRHRSQAMNREAALGRFVELLEEALQEPKPRRKTKASDSAKQRRLKEKARRGEIKKLRTEKPAAD
jgi:ribosome-associated protein